MTKQISQQQRRVLRRLTLNQKARAQGGISLKTLSNNQETRSGEQAQGSEGEGTNVIANADTRT
jgi:hypothetical protein